MSSELQCLSRREIPLSPSTNSLEFQQVEREGRRVDGQAGETVMQIEGFGSWRNGVDDDRLHPLPFPHTILTTR